MGKRMLEEQRFRIRVTAVLTFSLHLMYAMYNGVLGIIYQSVWFYTMCVYYAVLSSMRLSVVLCEYKGGTAPSMEMEFFVMKLCGALLVVLSVVLAGTNYISLSQNIAARRDEIMMITIAAYTFSKLTAAIVKAVKQRKNPSPILSALRTIRYAEVAASVLTLQRSMLVSFDGMEEVNIRIMNILSGSAVFLFVLALGAAMIRRGKQEGTK